MLSASYTFSLLLELWGAEQLSGGEGAGKSPARSGGEAQTPLQHPSPAAMTMKNEGEEGSCAQGPLLRVQSGETLAPPQFRAA